MCFAKRPQNPKAKEECPGLVDFGQPIRIAGDCYGFACEKCDALYDHTGKLIEGSHFTVNKKSDGRVVLRDKATGHEDQVQPPFQPAI